MTATVKKLPKSQVELTITVLYADYIKAQEAAMQEIGKQIKVDGFRSGHIPEALIREKVSESTIQGMTLEQLVPLSYSRAVKEHDLQVIEQPKIEIKEHVKKEGDSFIYTATVSVMPEVKMGDYKKIKVKRKPVKVSQKELDETIDMLLSRFPEWNDVDRPAKEGDRVEADFEGFDADGKALPNTASKNHPIILGSKSMVPGFEEEIIGMKKDQEKEFQVTFPKDYHAKQMQGQKVRFKLKVGRIEEKKAQGLDEEMIEKMVGQKQSIDDFKKRVEEDLEREMKQRAQAEVDNKVVAEIIKQTSADLPESLILDEIRMLKQERQQAVSQQGLSWEQYLQHVKKTDEDFEKDHRKGAEERLLARLAVNHIIKEEKIHATDEEVDARIAELMTNYPDNARQEVLDYYKKGSEAYRQLKNNMSADKLISMFVED